jgi:8-oxo-dGTP diphosphatase
MAINTEPDIHKQVICTNVFIRKGEKYLLLRRSLEKRFAPGVVHPVGGKMDLDEDPFVAAEREVAEETGVRVKNMRLEAVLNEIKPPPDFDYNWTIYHFSADWAAGEVGDTEEGELVWLSAEEIQAEQLFPSLRVVIDRVLDPKAGTVFATFNWRGNELADERIIHECAR